MRCYLILAIMAFAVAQAAAVSAPNPKTTLEESAGTNQVRSTELRVPYVEVSRAGAIEEKAPEATLSVAKAPELRTGAEEKPEVLLSRTTNEEVPEVRDVWTHHRRLQWQPHNVAQATGGNLRGVFSEYLSPTKKVKPQEENNHNHHYGVHPEFDNCKRKYPLTPRNAQHVSYAFNRYGISPELTPPPHEYAEVIYSKLPSCQPNLGNEVNVCGVCEQPALNWNCKSDKLYTILFVDLYPVGEAHRKLLSQGILWWVVDVPGCDIAKGKVLYAYQKPLPLYGAGFGKYTILVYEQPSYKIDWSEESVVSAKSEAHRYYNSLEKIVNKYQLKLLAGNFFVAEFQSCIIDAVKKLDPPPQYVLKGISAANLPPYINVRNALVNDETQQTVHQKDDKLSDGSRDDVPITAEH